MCGHRRLVVQFVLLLAINIAAEAAFAKGGPLHLFSSEARFPSVSESVNSPSLVLGGLRSRALPRTYYAKSVEARPISPGEFASARSRT